MSWVLSCGHTVQDAGSLDVNHSFASEVLCELQYRPLHFWASPTVCTKRKQKERVSGASAVWANVDSAVQEA